MWCLSRPRPLGGSRFLGALQSSQQVYTTLTTSLPALLAEEGPKGRTWGPPRRLGRIVRALLGFVFSCWPHTPLRVPLRSSHPLSLGAPSNSR